ncbi:MAG: M3 family oligoendopeptidase, partial [Anaerolineae bacterium]
MNDMSFEQGRWSLDDLLPATRGPELDRVLEELEGAVVELEASRDQLSAAMTEGEFQRLMALVERIHTLSSRLGAYGYLWYAGDTQDEDALAFRGRMDQLLSQVENRTLFFSLWWKALDEENAQRLL